MMNKVYSFEDLTCWKKARTFKRGMYKLANRIPSFEEYALRSQIRRAPVSVAANIAKGMVVTVIRKKFNLPGIPGHPSLSFKIIFYSGLDAGYIT